MPTSEGPDSDSDKDGIVMRTARHGDGAEMWRLAHESEALEENTLYAYLLLAEHFRDTCVVAELNGEFVGYIAGYIPPTKPDVVFVWQIGVSQRARKRGLGVRMLAHLMDVPACREQVRYLEATVGRSNEPSQRLFKSLARRIGAECKIGTGFSSSDFRYQEHEDEDLFRIGPREVSS